MWGGGGGGWLKTILLVISMRKSGMMHLVVVEMSEFHDQLEVCLPHLIGVSAGQKSDEEKKLNIHSYKLYP